MFHVSYRQCLYQSGMCHMIIRWFFSTGTGEVSKKAARKQTRFWENFGVKDFNLPKLVILMTFRIFSTRVHGDICVCKAKTWSFLTCNVNNNVCVYSLWWIWVLNLTILQSQIRWHSCKVLNRKCSYAPSSTCLSQAQAGSPFIFQLTLRRRSFYSNVLFWMVEWFSRHSAQ